MKKTSNNSLKASLLAGFVMAAVSSAQAYSPLGGAYALGDAVAGFTTGSGNELVVNLGPISSLSNGEQWNLATLLGPGSGNAGFANLNNLNWGVLGISASQYYSTVIFNSAAKGNAANANFLTTMFSGTIGSSGSAVQSVSATYSWYNNADTANSGFVNSPFASLGGSTDTTTPASGSFTFAQDAATWYKNGTTSGAGAQALGFSFNSSGILMYGSTSVPQPILTITPSGAKVILSWPTSATGFTLEQTTSISPPANWSTNSTVPVVVGGNYTVTNPASSSAYFYRLIH